MLKTELNTSNKTSQDLADVNGRHTRGVLQKSPHSKFDSPVNKHIGRLGQDLGPSVGGNELFGARVEYNKATGHTGE